MQRLLVPRRAGAPVGFAALAASAIAFGGIAAGLVAGLGGSEAHAASPRIVQGTVSIANPSVGALLQGDSAENAGFSCSGVLVGCSTFLTAGHCTCLGNSTGADCQPPNAPDPSEYFVYLQHAGLLSVSDIQVHPDFDFPTADVSILTLSSPVRGVVPATLGETRPVSGSPGRIVGFGSTGGEARDFNLKREGTVQTAPCTGGLDDSDLVCWNFTGDMSNTCGGDSGGALFIDFGQGEILSGITSGGERSSCLAPDHSYDADMAVLGPWIEDQAGDPTLASFLSTVTHCGAGPTLGDAEVAVASTESIASLALGDDITEFEVGEGARELRVAMNVERGTSADIDLVVRAGEAPSEVEFDCAVSGSGRNASCVIANPQPGPWFAAARPVFGVAEYQLLATTFLRAPACADVNGDGEATSGDALDALQASVDIIDCALEQCDLSGDGTLTATDALNLLKLAVGVSVPLFCP